MIHTSRKFLFEDAMNVIIGRKSGSPLFVMGWLSGILGHIRVNDSAYHHRNLEFVTVANIRNFHPTLTLRFPFPVHVFTTQLVSFFSHLASLLCTLHLAFDIATPCNIIAVSPSGCIHQKQSCHLLSYAENRSTASSQSAVFQILLHSATASFRQSKPGHQERWLALEARSSARPTKMLLREA